MKAASIFPADDQNIERVADALRAGDVAAIPTETVYGLAGAAFHLQALTKIFKAKDRPAFDPLILHVAPPNALWGPIRFGTDWLEQLIEQNVVDSSQMTPQAVDCFQTLSRAFWPGPLTLVVPKQPVVPDLATSGLPTVAVRAPRHPAAQALIRAVGQPLAAPSANQFGRVSPTTAQAVALELGDRIRWILDGGPSQVGLESTVAAISSVGDVTILRPGGASPEDIAKALGQEITVGEAIPSQPNTLASPGTLSSHYSPRTPLRLLPEPIDQLTLQHRDRLRKLVGDTTKIGLLMLHGDQARGAARLRTALGDDDIKVLALSLSRRQDWDESARNLFAAMRTLDESPDVERILAEPVVHPTGLAIAIADRLRRAAHNE